MILCSNECIPCCDFCAYAIHDEIEYEGKKVLGGPIGCGLHPSAKYQHEAEMCGYCDDYKCYQADREKGKWVEIPYGEYSRVK